VTWLAVTVGDASAAGAAVRAGADMLDTGAAGPAAVRDIRARHPGVLLCAQWRQADLARPPEGRLICADVPAATAAVEAGVPREAILVATRPPGIRELLAAGWAVLADVDHWPGTAGILPGQAAAVGQITPRQQNCARPAGEGDGMAARTGDAAGEMGADAVAGAAGAAGPAPSGADAVAGAAGAARPAPSGADAVAGAARPAPSVAVAAGAGDPEEVHAAVAAAAVCAWMGVAAVRTRHVRAVRRALDMTASIRGARPPAWAVRGLA
jgi:hypothetical protein